MYPLELDLAARTAIHGTQTDILTGLAFALTFIGSAAVLTGLVVLAAGILLYAGRKFAARTLIVAMTGEAMLQNGLKALFTRPRPTSFFGTDPGGYSFPSGHALSAFCFCGALALLARWWPVASPGRLAVAVAGAVMTLGIGWSRLYLGVHYLSDVVGGYVIGAAWLAFLAATGQFRSPARLPP